MDVVIKFYQIFHWLSRILEWAWGTIKKPRGKLKGKNEHTYLHIPDSLRCIHYIHNIFIMGMQRCLVLCVMLFLTTFGIQGPPMTYAIITNPATCGSTVNVILSSSLCTGILSNKLVCCSAISSACASGVLTSLSPSTFTVSALTFLNTTCNINITGITAPPPSTSTCTTFLSTLLSGSICSNVTGIINPTSLCCSTIVGASACGTNGTLVQSIPSSSFTTAELQVLIECGLRSGPTTP